MKVQEQPNDTTIARRRSLSRALFGGPVTLRTSFILTVVFDFSLLMIAGTVASAIWGF